MAEFFGTYLLTLIFLSSDGNPLFSGATLGLILLLVGKISGGHVNPAISLANYMAGKLSRREFLTYIVFQFLGASAAFCTTKVLA
jgi:glycerol uptake facilitator-like aquaporin